jgi:hypothetical protein
VGFEPTDPFGSTVFKTVAINQTRPLLHNWWRMTGSNRRPSACKADALPTVLIPHKTGPCGEIRTPDPLLPKQMRYQTALHTDGLGGQNRTAIIGFGDQGNAIIRHRDYNL